MNWVITWQVSSLLFSQSPRWPSRTLPVPRTCNPIGCFIHRTAHPSFLSIYPSIYIFIYISVHIYVYTTLIGPIANNNPTKSNYTCIINMFKHAWYTYYSCTHPDDVFLTRFGVNVVIKIKVTYRIDILHGQAGLPMHTIHEGVINYYFQNETSL